jgi:DnaK suppressor protein
MSSDAALADLRAALEAERGALVQQLADLGAGEYDANFADSSQVTAERGEVEALAGTLREHLDEVEHALGKLEGSSYGICESCGNPIAPARLEALPAARYCIDCASKHR